MLDSILSQSCCSLVLMFLLVPLQANKPEYYLLDSEKFLRQQLAGKTVIEFPVLLVLLPGEEAKYTMTVSENKTNAPSNAAGLQANPSPL